MLDWIFLDLDHTLYDYNLCFESAYEAIYNYLEEKYDIPRNDLEKLLKKAQTEVKLELGLIASSHNRLLYFQKLIRFLRQHDHNDIPLSEIPKINHLYWSVYLDKIIQARYPNLIEWLTWVTNQGIKICLITDFLLHLQYAKLEKLQVLNYITDIISSEEVGQEKPHPTIFRKALEVTGADPNRTWMIGDRLDKDILGATRLGIWGCLIKPINHLEIDHQPDSNIEFHSDYFTFQTYKQLLEFCQELFQTIQNLADWSQSLGDRFDLVQAGGGNISVKTQNRKLMLIKSSGKILSEVTPMSGFVCLDNSLVETAIQNWRSNTICRNQIESDMKKISQQAKLFHITGLASIETGMHALLNKITIHLHHLESIYLSSNQNLLTLIKHKFRGIKCLLIDYETPGLILAHRIAKELEISSWRVGQSVVIILRNHGLILSTDSESDMKKMLTVLDSSFGQSDINDYQIKGNQISRLRSYLTRVGQIQPFHVYLTDDPIINQYFHKCELETSFFPDKVVYVGLSYLHLKNEQLDNQAEIEYHNYLKILGEHPKVIVWRKQIFMINQSLFKCRQTEELLKAHCLTWSPNVQKLSIEESQYLAKCDMEKYRKNL